MKKDRKRLLIWVMILSFFLLAGGVKAQGKGILMIIAPGDFRDEEFQIPKGSFERAGYQVTVASATTQEVRGMLGARVKPDILLQDVDVSKYQAIVFVGGVGAQVYFSHPQAQRIAKEAYSQGKVLGAICIAPVILARAGVLQGKRATVWASVSEEIEKGGGHYTGKLVEVDGRLITGNGPAAAKEFAKRIIEALKK